MCRFLGQIGGPQCAQWSTLTNSQTADNLARFSFFPLEARVFSRISVCIFSVPSCSNNQGGVRLEESFLAYFSKRLGFAGLELHT